MHTHGLGALRPKTFRRSVRRLVAGVASTSLLTLGLTGLTLTPVEAAPVKTVAATSSTALAPGIYERRVLRQVNIRRANHDLRKLRFAACPSGTAKAWSRYLAANDAFFHQSMTNVLNTCNARYAGETLGRGTMGPGKLVKMWMHSPAHREILLTPKARRIGIGATPDTSGRWVVAANFVRF